MKAALTFAACVFVCVWAAAILTQVDTEDLTNDLIVHLLGNGQALKFAGSNSVTYLSVCFPF